MAERSYGEGSIRERADGRWEGRTTIPGEDGKPKQKSVYGKTSREVEQKLRRLIGQKEAGLPIPPEKLTVAEYLRDWHKNVAATTLRPNTLATYEINIRLHIVPSIGHFRLAKLTARHVEKFQRDMLDKGKAPRTVLYAHAVLQRALAYAEKTGLVARNVAALVDAPRTKKPEIAVIDVEQAGKLLASLQTDRLLAFYTIAICLGLRRGEILGLRWRDVDLVAGTLRVEQAILPVHGKLAVTEPKSASSRRLLRLPKLCVDALTEHKIRQVDERERAGWQERGLVFTSRSGTAIEPKTISRHFKRTLVLAGLPPIRFHDLRHSAISIMLASGMPPKLVSELAGHSSAHFTMDVYGHLFDAAYSEPADLMDRLLGPEQARL